MSTTEVVDAILRFLEIIVSWPILLLVLMLLIRQTLPELISKLGDRITKAPGGFEFAVKEVKEQLQSVAEKVERIQAAVEFVSTPSLSPFLRDQLQSALDAFAEYMRGIGIEVEDRVLVKVDKEVSGVAFYDPAAKLIVIDESVAADMDLVLHEAAHHYILRPPKVLADLGGNGYSALEAGLVDYLVASFKNDPAIAKVFAQLRLGQDHVRNLENDAKFSRDVMGDPVHAIGEVWGGCFWEVRRLLGRDITDRSLYEAWAALAPADLRSGDVSRFVERVVQLQPDAEDEVREVFERRDISALTKKRPRRGR